MKRLIASVICLVLASPAWAEQQIGSESAGAEAKLARTKKLVQEQNDGVRASAWKPDMVGEQDSLSEAGLKMVKGLGLCVGGLLIALHFYRKKYPRSTASVGRQLRIIERLPINAKTSLVMAEIAGKRVVMAVGADRVSTIVPDADIQVSDEMIELPMEYVCDEEPRRSVA